MPALATVATPLPCALGSNALCTAAAALSVSPVGSMHGAFGQDTWGVECSWSWQGSCSRVSTPAWVCIGVLDHATPRGSWPIDSTGTQPGAGHTHPSSRFATCKSGGVQSAVWSPRRPTTEGRRRPTTDRRDDDDRRQLTEEATATAIDDDDRRLRRQRRSTTTTND